MRAGPRRSEPGGRFAPNSSAEGARRREILKLARLSTIGVPEIDRSYFDPAFRGPAYFGPKFYRVFGPPRRRG